MRPGTHVEVGYDVSPTLAARDYKDPIFFAYKNESEENMSENKIQIPPDAKYVVRRLTPTECARLQGFYDRWGHPGILEDMTDEQYAFWLNVRQTYDSINGRQEKQYTKPQILKWYNGLHTDAAEYKMWGNGISLPCVEFIMQGIVETAEH